MKAYSVTIFDDGSVTVNDEDNTVYQSWRTQAEGQTKPAYLRQEAAQATAELYTYIMARWTA